MSNYTNRLEKLEAIVAPKEAVLPDRMLICFVCPERGVVSILVIRPGTSRREWFERGNNESEDELRARAEASV